MLSEGAQQALIVLCVCVCVCVCVSFMCFGGFDGLLLFKLVPVFSFCIFNKSVFSLSQSLARHAGATVSEVPQGLLRWLGGGITRGDAVGGALTF